MEIRKKYKIIYFLFSLILIGHYFYDTEKKVEQNIVIKEKKHNKEQKKVAKVKKTIVQEKESKIKINFSDFEYVKLKEHYQVFLTKAQRILDNNYNVDHLNNEMYNDCPFEFKAKKIDPLILSKLNTYLEKDNKYDLRNLSINFFIEDKIEFENINESYLSIYEDIIYYKKSVKGMMKESIITDTMPKYTKLISECLSMALKEKLTEEFIVSLNSNEINEKYPLGFKKLFIYYYNEINNLEDSIIVEDLIEKALSINEKFEEEYMERNFNQSIGFLVFSKEINHYQERFLPMVYENYSRIKNNTEHLADYLATSNNTKAIELYKKIDKYFKENFSSNEEYYDFYDLNNRNISSENQ